MSDSLQDLIARVKGAETQPIPEEMSDVDRMIGLAYQHAKRVLVGQPGAELMPVWCLLTETGQSVIVATPFIGEHAKEMVAVAMRGLMREVGAIRYTFASECWMATMTPEERARDGRPPSERDDRVECVMILGADRRGSSMDCYEMKRDWRSGQVVDLAPMDKGEGKRENGLVDGRFANLLSAG